MSFNFTYRVKNLGNIDNAEIIMKPLTIIAGENSSGKTFITKSLYTILNTVGTAHFTNKLRSHYLALEYAYQEFVELLHSPATIDLDFFEYFDNVLHEFQSIITNLESLALPDQSNIIADYVDKLLDIYEHTQEYINKRIRLKKFQRIIDSIGDFTSTFDDFQMAFENPGKIIVDSISIALSEGFKKNFQITKTEFLIQNNQSKNAKLNISTVGDVELLQKSDINFNFTHSGIKEVQKLSNIVFFDSPIYMKIRKALQSSNRNSMFNHRFLQEDKYLKGYPEYIEELYQYTDQQYIDIPNFDAISAEIQNAISGKLVVTKGGDIVYKDFQGNEIPLALTAMGIGNIGTIDLLIRNNIINQGSFLIMDEPEVHLHPEWQVKLAQILYKIAKSGANVVIATHSIDFLKAIQVLLKKEDDASNYIALNKMPYTDDFAKMEELEKAEKILDNLSSPFYNLYLEGL